MIKPFVTFKIGSYWVDVKFTAILCAMAFAIFFFALIKMSDAASNATDLVHQYIFTIGVLVSGGFSIFSLIPIVTDEFGISITKEE